MYEKNRSITIHEQNTLTHFKPMLQSRTPWKNKKTAVISIVDIDPKIAEHWIKCKIKNFNIKRSGTSSRLAEL